MMGELEHESDWGRSEIRLHREGPCMTLRKPFILPFRGYNRLSLLSINGADGGWLAYQFPDEVCPQPDVCSHQ